MTYKTRRSASQQISSLGFVVLLHVVAIYAVASGLAHRAVETVMGPIETKVIEEAKPKQEELPPPPPKLQTPPPYVPPPDLDVAIDAPPPTTASHAIQTVTTQKTVAPPPAPVADVVPRFDPRARANAFPESEYPDQSRRLGEEGEVIISVLVGADGKVTDGKIEKGSGFERLDKAALDYYMRRGKFLPGTKDGQPIPAWKSIKVTFNLKK
jgi:periplasmic protein TonB